MIMDFNVLYVEDDPLDYEDLWKAVRDHNKTGGPVHFNFVQAESPAEVPHKLSLAIDVVLADVVLPSYKGAGDERNRLAQVVKAVLSTVEGRNLPIIAYTCTGADTLRACLKLRGRLYDIWDKNNVEPRYVIWRLSQLAADVARLRPDKELQSLIRKMSGVANWHSRVVKMAEDYDEGRNESDQIERAGHQVGLIAGDLGVRGSFQQMWPAIKDWEPVERAVTFQTRGHARHAINVFWLGYYLLNDPDMLTFCKSVWAWLKSRGVKYPTDVDTADSRVVLSNIWFYAGLFHDVGMCVDRSREVYAHQSDLLTKFGDIAEPLPGAVKTPGRNLASCLDPLIACIGGAQGDQVRTAVLRNIKAPQWRPDHGIVSALQFVRQIAVDKHCETHQVYYASEAARAVALHNLVPSLLGDTVPLVIEWEDNPLGCLLMICDQIQTWDRERGDDNFKSHGPQRAELSMLQITSDKKGKPHIEMSIDYIAPRYLTRSPDLYKNVKTVLEDVIATHPKQALDAGIAKPWPFSLQVSFTLSGAPLAIELRF
jgi:hypothetical protein